MNVYHQRVQWDPDSASLIVPSDENLDLIFREKQEAMEEVSKLADILKPETLGLPEAVTSDLIEMLDLYRYYVEGFMHMAKVYFRMQKYQTEHVEQDKVKVEEDNASLKAFVVSLKKRLKGTRYPFYIYWMINPGELESLAADVEKSLEAEV